jgi:hypothetical protein
MSTRHRPIRRRAPGHRDHRKLVVHVLAATTLLALTMTNGAAALDDPRGERTIDGSNNNLRHPTWGQANIQYRRNAAARYADGRASQVGGPSPRLVSNRIFNDGAQNIFSENGVSQWGFTWGQFLDHTFGLRATAGGEAANLAFDAADPLEEFRNDFGVIQFTRTPAAPGTGVTNTRQQINTIDSYIDASAVYGNTRSRLEWLREGSVDDDLDNNSPRLLLSNGFLPRSSARGNAATAPPMDIDGLLRAAPDHAMVAGDVRANENLALLGTQTLFAREHNRIVNALPSFLSNDLRFDIARRVVGAEQQFITYNEFLPALGVTLSPYRGYNPNVDATLSNEFAVVGYRAHSMIHGELEPIAEAGTYTDAQLEAFEDQGVEVEVEGDEVVLVIPLNVAFFNPDLITQVGLGPLMKGIGAEPQYKNDEQIDNQLRSVLFQVPRPDAPDPSTCLDGPSLPNCFQGVQDLGAIDIQRGRDHGMPSYNQLRAAYGLAPKTSFTAITGEATDRFPSDPLIDPADPIDDPNILDFVELRDADGNVLPAGSEEGAVVGIRRTTTAARLRAIYGNVGNLDAFTGMLAERHVTGSDLGELQRTMWRREFERLRDGDRFFYANDPALLQIRLLFGIDYRRTLAQVITDNTELNPGDVEANVFLAPSD